MIEIKFRAFVRGKMGDTFNPFDPEFMMQVGTFPEGTIIMQFTGLKDKNGTPIFEGDIVDNGLSGTWVIQPLENGAMSLLGVCKQYRDKNFDISALNQNAKVIGNIYQHPEILK